MAVVDELSITPEPGQMRIVDGARAEARARDSRGREGSEEAASGS
jgi:hypothetical protein